MAKKNLRQIIEAQALELLDDFKSENPVRCHFATPVASALRDMGHLAVSLTVYDSKNHPTTEEEARKCLRGGKNNTAKWVYLAQGTDDIIFIAHKRWSAAVSEGIARLSRSQIGAAYEDGRVSIMGAEHALEPSITGAIALQEGRRKRHQDSLPSKPPPKELTKA